MKKLMIFLIIILLSTVFLEQVFAGSQTLSFGYYLTAPNGKYQHITNEPLSVAPTPPEKGMFYYHLGSGFKFYEEGQWKTLSGSWVQTQNATLDNILYPDTIDSRVGVGDDSPDAIFELSDQPVPLGIPYLMLSSLESNDGDILIVDSFGKLGLGTNTPSAFFTIDGRGATASTEGIVAIGNTSNAALGVSGAGARMMWIPQRGALRAGGVNNDGAGEDLWWDHTVGSPNIGKYSTGLGYNVLAKGDHSVAMGQNNQALESNAVAIGTNNIAGTGGGVGLNSIVLGADSSATNDYAVALGTGATAQGQGSVAMGYNSRAEGVATVALGVGAQVTGPNCDFSYAFGPGIEVTGRHSIAMSLGAPYVPITFQPTMTLTQDNTLAIMGPPTGGKVGINVLDPDASLVVAGQIKLTDLAGLPKAITNLDLPVNNTDGASKEYVDQKIDTKCLTSHNAKKDAFGNTCTSGVDCCPAGFQEELYLGEYGRCDGSSKAFYVPPSTNNNANTCGVGFSYEKRGDAYFCCM